MSAKPKRKVEKKEKGVSVKDLEKEIVDEAIKIAKNEVSHCYDLVQKSRQLIALRSN